MRRSRLRSIFTLRKFSIYVSLFLCFVRLISPLPSGITCLSNQKKHEGFEAKLGNSSSSVRWDDGGWDHRGRSLGDLTSAWMIAWSSQPRNCHFLCFISRKPHERSECDPHGSEPQEQLSFRSVFRNKVNNNIWVIMGSNYIILLSLFYGRKVLEVVT